MKNSVACVMLVLGTLLLFWPLGVALLWPSLPYNLREYGFWYVLIAGHVFFCFSLGASMLALVLDYFRRH